MQDRLKEIQDRVDNYSCEDSEFIINSKQDIIFLLATLQEAQIDKDMVVSFLEMSENNLHRSQKEIGELMHDRREARDRERALRQALEYIYNATAPGRGLTMHETTQIYVRAREALNQKGDKHNGNK